MDHNNVKYFLHRVERRKFMDWLIITVFFTILVICAVVIVLTLASLPKLGDERKNFIKMKAQSNAFAVVIGLVLIEIGESIYKEVWSNGSYEGINPFSFIVAISVIYLISLLYSKKKYGG